MVRYLFCREGTGIGTVSRGTWNAHFHAAQLHAIDERDQQGNGIIRIVTYDPNTETRPEKYGEIHFTFPDDREAYERYREGNQ
jgi:hypothetical protein